MGDKVRPIDNPIIDQDGNTWLLFAPLDGAVPPTWTMVEPVDKDKWDAIMAGKMADVDPSDIRGRVDKC